MLEEKKKSNAVTNIRNVFRSNNIPMTLNDIKKALPDLKPNEISMTLCYFLRQRYVKRELIENTIPKERKKVWKYTYSESRYPLEVTNEN
jgi:hypothetical protein